MSETVVVLINGFGTNGSELKYLFRRIKRECDYDVINYDYVPGGYKDDKYPRINKRSFNEFIEKIINDTKEIYENVYFIGYSVGAVTAMKCSLLSKNIKKMVLIAPLLEYKNVRHFLSGFAKSFIHNANISKIERTFYNIAFKRSTIIPKLNFWHVDRFLRNSRKVYENVICDTLIINTKKDELINQKTIDYLYNTIGSKVKRVFDIDATHLLFFNRDKRKIVADEIIDYLSN